MTVLRVDAAAGLLIAPQGALPCAIGRAGIIAATDKREGDGASPIGTWPIGSALLRPDRVPAPRTALPWRWLHPSDGWSDDPADPSYNRPVSHPHRYSAERLWREDALYDVIVILGHNDAPPVPGLGSAIFLHVAPPEGVTAGCVAIERSALLSLLETLVPGDAIEIG